MVYRMPQKTWLVQEEVILCTNGGETFNRYGKNYGRTGTMRPSGIFWDKKKSAVIEPKTETQYSSRRGGSTWLANP